MNALIRHGLPLLSESLFSIARQENYMCRKHIFCIWFTCGVTKESQGLLWNRSVDLIITEVSRETLCLYPCQPEVFTTRTKHSDRPDTPHRILRHQITIIITIIIIFHEIEAGFGECISFICNLVSLPKGSRCNELHSGSHQLHYRFIFFSSESKIKRLFFSHWVLVKTFRWNG